MGILDKFKTKNQNIEIVEIEENKIRGTKEEIQKKLYDIQFNLTKIELISKSHGEITFIENELKKHKDQFEKIKYKYSSIDAYEYPNRVYFLAELSTLEDELKPFSKVCFYLEDLHDFKNVKITKENIKSQKQILLKLIKEISEYHYQNKEVDDRLHDSLNELVFEIIQDEIKNDDIGLYDELPIFSQLEVRKRFLELLLKKSKEDKNIKDYLDKNDIADIEFSYDLFKRLLEEKVEPVKIESRLDLNDSSFKTFMLQRAPRLSRVNEENNNRDIEDFKFTREELKEKLNSISDEEFDENKICKILKTYLRAMIKKYPNKFENLILKCKGTSVVIGKAEDWAHGTNFGDYDDKIPYTNVYKKIVTIYFNGKIIYKGDSRTTERPGYVYEDKFEDVDFEICLDTPNYKSLIHMSSCILGFDVNKVIEEIKKEKNIYHSKTK